jgi:hypothetical protein
LLSGPRWTGTASLGWSLYPGGQAADPGTAGTIAAVIAADVAAGQDDHPEVLDQAAQARERAGRDLKLLEPQITATRQQLDELLRTRDQLRGTTRNADDDPPGSTILDYVRLDPQEAALFVVHTAQLRMDGEGPGPDGDDSRQIMANDDACDTVHSLSARPVTCWAGTRARHRSTPAATAPPPPRQTTARTGTTAHDAPGTAP